MYFKPEDRNKKILPHDVFKGLIVPRPIGWISTMNNQGIINLAPYSFFNGVYSWPNILGFSSEDRKDSLNFAEESGEFTWNMATWSLKEQMNLSSEGLKTGESEFEYAGLTPETGKQVKCPRVAESPASLECKVTQIVDLNDIDGNKTSATVVFGQVVGVYIDEKCLTNGRVDVTKLSPIARCGYNEYTVLKEVFTMERPPNAGNALGGKPLGSRNNE